MVVSRHGQLVNSPVEYYVEAGFFGFKIFNMSVTSDGICYLLVLRQNIRTISYLALIEIVRFLHTIFCPIILVTIQKLKIQQNFHFYFNGLSKTQFSNM
jgi:hypothetical protein